MKPATPRNSRYWLRLALFFVMATAAAIAILPALLGVTTMLGLLYAPCAAGRHTPADFGLPAEAVQIPATTAGSFRGYFIPGKNGAAIIMPPPFTSDRAARLPEAARLARHGYSVLTFESRRCAGLGPLSLGYVEVSDVTDALTYLTGRPEVDSTRIGIHGFSSAGATAILAAAADVRLRAVVAEGGYSDFLEGAIGRGDTTRPFSRYFFVLYRWGVKTTYRLVTGTPIQNLSPVAVIGRLEPRPLLLIYGSREPSLAGGRQQAAAAGPSTQLWVVEGAGHGNYAQIAPVEYERRLVEFFDAALTPPD